jgi:hypothetical protein
MTNDSPGSYFDQLSAAVDDPVQIRTRQDTAKRLSAALTKIGEIAFVSGHILGTDRRDGRSPFGHGNDAVVAVSRLASIASQLTSGSADLIRDGRVYAGSALLRQLVEVEYLAKSFSEDSQQASEWLRSDKPKRMRFFSPRKLREASAGFFRDGDYTWHCEMGGNPVPNSGALLENRNNMGQLLLSDAIGHAGRIAQYALTFLDGRESLLGFDALREEVVETLHEWRNRDELTRLPPPPLPSADAEQTLH